MCQVRVDVVSMKREKPCGNLHGRILSGGVYIQPVRDRLRAVTAGFMDV